MSTKHLIFSASSELDSYVIAVPYNEALVETLRYRSALVESLVEEEPELDGMVYSGGHATAYVQFGDLCDWLHGKGALEHYEDEGWALVEGDLPEMEEVRMNNRELMVSRTGFVWWSLTTKYSDETLETTLLKTGEAPF